jgi:ribosomal RNA-processing protein 12
MLLLTALIPALPKSRLHLVPALLSEAVLGTKEVNEKARDAAFNLLVVMAQKMSQGGTIQHGLIGAAEDDEEMEAPADAAASVEEFITMTAAGLAGTTPHMISASITALSRLLFEFKGG